jgi:putative dehydrogenase
MLSRGRGVAWGRNMMDRQIGVIGLGIMGGAMVRNLMEQGWTVFGHDLAPARQAALAAVGLRAAESVAAVVRHATVVITSLPSPEAARGVAEQIAASGFEPRIVVETSTLALADKLAFRDILQAAGHLPLDCPLSGTGAQAATRDLVVYASGDPAAIEACRPVFAGFARAAHDVGAYGNGSRMKFIANLLVAIHNVAAAEAMLLGERAGLDPAQLVELAGAGAGGSRMFDMRAPMMARHDYLPATMRVSTWMKDMAIIGAFARETGAPTPLFDRTLPIYAAALAQGLGDADTAAVHAVLKAHADHEK